MHAYPAERAGKRSLAAPVRCRPSGSRRARPRAPAAPQPHEARSDRRATPPVPPRAASRLAPRAPSPSSTAGHPQGRGRRRRRGSAPRPGARACSPRAARRRGRESEERRAGCGAGALCLRESLAAGRGRGAAPAPAERRRDARLRRGAAFPPCSTLLSLARSRPWAPGCRCACSAPRWPPPPPQVSRCPAPGPFPGPLPAPVGAPGKAGALRRSPPAFPRGFRGAFPPAPARAGVRLPPPAILAASPRAVRPVPPPPPHGARGAEWNRGGASATAPRIGCPSACGAVRLRPRAAVPSARLGLRYSRQGGGHLRARRELLWIHRRTAGGFFQSGLRGVLAFLRTVGFERLSMEGERAPRAPCPVPIAGGGALPDLGLDDASCLFPKCPTLRMRLSV